MNYKKNVFETFNDGIAEIYCLKDVSAPGFKPDMRPELMKKFHFKYKTIGVKRYYEAAQSHVKIDELISIPCDRNISTQDICRISGVTYEIKQIQHKAETRPATTLLSLTRTEVAYDFI